MSEIIICSVFFDSTSLVSRNIPYERVIRSASLLRYLDLGAILEEASNGGEDIYTASGLFEDISLESEAENGDDGELMSIYSGIAHLPVSDDEKRVLGEISVLVRFYEGSSGDFNYVSDAEVWLLADGAYLEEYKTLMKNIWASLSEKERKESLSRCPMMRLMDNKYLVA